MTQELIDTNTGHRRLSLYHSNLSQHWELTNHEYITYYEGINQGDHYLCDRCEVAKLSYEEYTNNHNPIN
jgi:hypothetical protein